MSDLSRPRRVQEGTLITKQSEKLTCLPGEHRWGVFTVVGDDGDFNVYRNIRRCCRCGLKKSPC